MRSLSNADCCWMGVDAIGYHAIKYTSVWWQLVAGQQADQMWVSMVKLHTVEPLAANSKTEIK